MSSLSYYPPPNQRSMTRSCLEILLCNQMQFEKRPHDETKVLYLKLSVTGFKPAFSWSPACISGIRPQAWVALPAELLALRQIPQTAGGNVSWVLPTILGLQLCCWLKLINTYTRGWPSNPLGRKRKQKLGFWQSAVKAA